MKLSYKMTHWRRAIGDTKECALKIGTSLEKIEVCEANCRKHAVATLPQGPEDARGHHIALCMHDHLPLGDKRFSWRNPLVKAYNELLVEYAYLKELLAKHGERAHNPPSMEALRSHEAFRYLLPLLLIWCQGICMKALALTVPRGCQVNELEDRVKVLKHQVEGLQRLLKHNGPGGYTPIYYKCSAMGHSEAECDGVCGSCLMPDHIRTGCDDTFHCLSTSRNDITKAVIKQEVKDDLKSEAEEALVAEYVEEAREVIQWETTLDNEV
ncbi:hypothetical protein BDZ45DRAFT_749264 [Acephala macrosclerotiorum]|nr:hypothetical protein BDZ45DRAFT_749264 [Acephala macrosclerotiorum]